VPPACSRHPPSRSMMSASNRAGRETEARAFDLRCRGRSVTAWNLGKQGSPFSASLMPAPWFPSPQTQFRRRSRPATPRRQPDCDHRRYFQRVADIVYKNLLNAARRRPSRVAGKIGRRPRSRASRPRWADSAPKVTRHGPQVIPFGTKRPRVAASRGRPRCWQNRARRRPAMKR